MCDFPKDKYANKHHNNIRTRAHKLLSLCFVSLSLLRPINVAVIFFFKLLPYVALAYREPPLYHHLLSSTPHPHKARMPRAAITAAAIMKKSVSSHKRYGVISNA